MTVTQKYEKVLQKMRSQVKTSQDVIFVHAADSYYFSLSQELQMNLHRDVFPRLENFTFIIYDLGFSYQDLAMVKKHCRCTVIKFPFQDLPEFLQDKNCFAWKVFVIAAHFEQANVIIWMDASLRVTNGSAIPDLVARTKVRGVQQSCDWECASPHRTLPEMYHSFGDSPCAHLSFRQCSGGFGAYHRELLVRHAVMRPWLACAVTKQCMCPEPFSKVADCQQQPDRTKIGDCHRFDQSAITTILAKLYRENYNHFAVPDYTFRAWDRG